MTENSRSEVKAASMAVDNQTINISGDLVKSAIRKLRQREPKLTAGESYRLTIENEARIDSAGLAYIVNLIMVQKNTGGNVSLTEIPSSLSALIALAELNFVFE